MDFVLNGWLSAIGLLVIPVLAAVLTLFGTAVTQTRQRNRERRNDAARVLIRAVIDAGEDAYRENYRSLSGPATFKLIAAGLEFAVEMRGKGSEVSLWVVDQIAHLQNDELYANPVEFGTQTRRVAGKLADWAAGASPTRRFRDELSPDMRSEYEDGSRHERTNRWWRRVRRFLREVVRLRPITWHGTWVAKTSLSRDG